VDDIVKGRLKLMWKEAVVAYFKVLSKYPPGANEENYENLRISGHGVEFRTRTSHMYTH